MMVDHRVAASGSSAPLRIALVDDSALARRLVRSILEREVDLIVSWEAADGREALDRLADERSGSTTDVLLLDLYMPGLDGLATLDELARRGGGPRVVMLSAATRRGARETLEALARGAIDYVCKPAADATARADFERELVGKLRAIGRCRQPRPMPPDGMSSVRDEMPSVRPATHAPDPARDAQARQLPAKPDALPDVQPRPTLVGIAASTGGPQALSVVLQGLNRPFPLPILITQHMPPGFTAALADHLARTTGHPCTEARSGDIAEPGHVYIAPGDHHLVVARASPLTLRLDDSPPRHFCRPAADPMFESMAQSVGSGAIAVVLTGMGRDGAEGAARIAARGGIVVAQDEATSVVWGMPGATVRAGAASRVLPLNEIPAFLMRTVRP
jgi:two-component system chemotaxis response regulator CheB